MGQVQNAARTPRERADGRRGEVVWIRPWIRREPLGIARLGYAAVWAAALTFSVVLAITMVKSVGFEMDFKGDLYGAGRAILSGQSPYHPALLDVQAALARIGREVGPLASPRYPATSLVAIVPLSLLPFQLAGILFMVLSVAAVAVALRLLDVRDWRCFAVTLISWPVVFGVWLGNLSPLLLLGAAAAWRWRSQVRKLGLAIASTIAAKLFLWPLAMWLMLTGRLRALRATIVATIALIVGAWAAISFTGMSAYPHMLADVASIGEGRGSSLVAFLLSIGLSVGLARATAFTVAAGLLAAAYKVGRHRQSDERAFGLTVMAALMATPVVWAHYLVLLFVPIALQSRTFSPIWFLPVLAGLGPARVATPVIWASLPDLVIEFTVIGLLCWPAVGRRASRSLTRRVQPGAAHGTVTRLPRLESPVAAEAALLSRCN